MQWSELTWNELVNEWMWLKKAGIFSISSDLEIWLTPKMKTTTYFMMGWLCAPLNTSVTKGKLHSFHESDDCPFLSSLPKLESKQGLFVFFRLWSQRRLVLFPHCCFNELFVWTDYLNCFARIVQEYNTLHSIQMYTRFLHDHWFVQWPLRIFSGWPFVLRFFYSIFILSKWRRKSETGKCGG